ncbi:dihydrolipoyllysine-residue acetyltransferase [Marinagarivorans algicola]|uniref:dihydrolipoyllysine-residue acetyltransferase n=1 Tax=Marinagarivorans algicola TaxID=1513270 RepID=UPI0006B53913|nr:dihydrolipoyllysine-residue acetyltransferase [Marinagarivorans algicola]
MAIETINVPDIGGAEGVDVIEISIAVGDTITVDQEVMVLESDKASMDIPSPKGGVVKTILVKEGDKVSEGTPMLELDIEGAAETAPVTASEPASSAPATASSSAELAVVIPDIGGAEDVDVIEICVAVGDTISEGDSIAVLESDKASMDIPSPADGKVVSISLKEGEKASEGTAVLVLATQGDAPEVPAPAAQASSAVTPTPSVREIPVPDIGGAEGVDVIEVCVAVGDTVAEGDSLVVLESDKASMEIPAPASGKVTALTIKVGDKASQGDVIGQMEVVAAAEPTATKAASVPQAASNVPAASNASQVATPVVSPVIGTEVVVSSSDVYAGPAVRKLARQLGVDLTEVKGTGTRNRVSFEDVHGFVHSVMKARAADGGITSGSGIPPVPEVDYAKFGEIELVKMSKIKQLTAEAMTRNWLNIPRVTQFDDADITDVEAFRKGMKAEAEKSGVKLTPMPFIIKAAATALQMHPSFNVAMHNDGEHIIQKKFIHIAVAVDTPRGLMVPVIQNVDQKGIYQIAKELIELAGKARDGKLKPAEMQGGCFTISSLGPIGGTGFTPMVSTTEAGILGVSKASMQPVWDGSAFQPRMMLPLSLSYDHRAVNGSDAGKFLTYLSTVMGDVRRLLL